jgi:hypothetical protein
VTKKNFQLSLYYYSCAGFVLLVFLGFFYYLFSNTKFVNLTFEVLLQTGITVCLLMSPFMILFWIFYKEALTEFKNHEIVHYNLIGQTRILWDDVIDLEVYLLRFRIKSKEGKIIVVRLPVYKNPSEVIKFINEKVQHASTSNNNNA